MESQMERKKHAHLAVQFSVYILSILIISFIIQNIFIVRSVKKSSKEDYSAFSEKIIMEDAEKIRSSLNNKCPHRK